MADDPTAAEADSDPIRTVADPGGARSKGYSADPGPAPPVPDNDPVPLADDRDVHGHVRRRNEDTVLPPTGRTDPAVYPPNDRTIAGE